MTLRLKLNHTQSRQQYNTHEAPAWPNFSYVLMNFTKHVREVLVCTQQNVIRETILTRSVGAKHKLCQATDTDGFMVELLQNLSGYRNNLYPRSFLVESLKVTM